jgi:hypothetical protein
MNRRGELVALAARLGVPAIYPFRENAASGGLRFVQNPTSRQ